MSSLTVRPRLSLRPALVSLIFGCISPLRLYLSSAALTEHKCDLINMSYGGPTRQPVQSGGGIHEFSDSQFGHVFAFGESRAIAIANMVLGLKQIQIRGEIRTNVDYTIDLLHASDYVTPFVTPFVPQKASTSSTALVSDYVGYLEKAQIPPKHISLVNSQVSLNIEGSKYMTHPW